MPTGIISEVDNNGIKYIRFDVLYYTAILLKSLFKYYISNMMFQLFFFEHKFYPADKVQCKVTKKIKHVLQKIVDNV